MDAPSAKVTGTAGPALFGRPLIFWLRYGGLVFAILAPVTDIDLGSPLNTTAAWHLALRLLGSFLYGWLFLSNVPLDMQGAKNRQIPLLLQILLGFAVSPSTQFLSAFSIPFASSPRTRSSWLRVLILCFAALIVVVAVISGPASLQQMGLLGRNPVLLLFFLINIAGSLIADVFAYAGACLLIEFAEGRRRLAETNRELLCLQAARQESARAEERLRLSGELHDALGHYLTSLSIQLEIASYRAGEGVAPSIAKAQIITRVLLAQVRETISSWQEGESMQLPSMLQKLTQELDGITAHLEAQEPLPALAPATAHALFRSAQEAVTNSLRHSGARNLWISLSQCGESLQLSIRDDGRGCTQFTPGNGLKGMRSRVEQLHGRLAMQSVPGEGFQVIIDVPWRQEVERENANHSGRG